MKRFLLPLILLALPMAVYADNSTPRAEWVMTKPSDTNKAAAEFLKTGVYPATYGEASLSFIHKKHVAKSTLNEKGGAKAESVKGDYWLFEMPTENIPAGTVVDFWTQLNSSPTEENHRFALEYLDGKKWLPAMPLDKDGGNYTTTTSDKHPRRLWCAVQLSKAIKKGSIAFRLRQVEDKPLTVTVHNPSPRGQFSQMLCYKKVEVRDTLQFLFLGNSFTYYFTYPMIFKEIAWHEGHYADCDIFISGGYTMEKHLGNKYSRAVVAEGGYDYAFLQDQSILPLLNGTPDDAGSKENMEKMIKQIRKYSPQVKPVIEITWGRKYGNNALGKYKHLAEQYPQIFADYEAMQSRLIEVFSTEAEELSAELSPVGYAWRIIRRERPDIELYWKDGHHQSYNGSYLAAAIAYLTIYRTPFGENAANAKLDAETAAYLRSVAERVVLQGEK